MSPETFRAQVAEFITLFLEQEWFGPPINVEWNRRSAEMQFRRKLAVIQFSCAANHLLFNWWLDEVFTECWRKYCCF
jgi:hypothetical protein